MHILYLIQYFGTPDDPATSDRAYDFVNEFARQGHKVTLITSDAFIKSPTHLSQNLESSVTFKLIHQPYQNTFNITQRFLAFLGFWLKAFTVAVQLRSLPNIIYASSTPMSVPILGALLSKLWRIPWIFEIRDLWPDFIFDVGVIRQKWIKTALYNIERWLYHDAKFLVSLSPETTDILKSVKHISKNKILTLPNGCPYPYPKPRQSKAQLVGKQRADLPLVLYAGSLGLANNVDWLIKTSAELLTETNATIAILGEGSEKPRVVKWFENLSSGQQERIFIKPFLPRTVASDWFWASDFSLISFANLSSLKATSPNKYFHSIATKSVPVTNHPGWVSEEIRLRKIGIVANNPNEAANQIKIWIDNKKLMEQAHHTLHKLYRSYRRDRMAQILLNNKAILTNCASLYDNNLFKS